MRLTIPDAAADPVLQHMFPATLFRRLTAVIVVLALAAPAWTVCRTVAAEPMAGMPCCHEAAGTSAGTVGDDCCRVQPDDPSSGPVTTAALSLRTASPAIALLATPASALGSDASHDRRTAAESRARPKTASYLLDSVLRI